MRLLLFILAAVLLIAAGAFFLVIPKRVDAGMNQIVPHTPYAIGEGAAALHSTLRVADLHNDALLWDRDFLQSQTRGHSDAPRLVKGRFRLQVLSSVTKTPRNLNYAENDAASDNITPLVIAQRWPMKTWGSLAERALHHAALAESAAKRSNGGLALVRTKPELAAALDSGAIAIVLATEGAHPLEGDLANLDRLYDAGFRMLGLQHFFDNELGGSLHGFSNAGLTDFGRAAVIAAEERGMIIDVAHSSEAVVRDVLAIAKDPLVVSHTGMRGHCENDRNFSDGLMREIAARGGLVGIGFWDGAVCEATVPSIAAAIVYAIETLGADHVALGSDYDGATTVPFDASEIAALTDALLKAGVSEDNIRAVMGENALRFFADHLPAE
jgi:microsomal dipeptidase-like Zn-dependent dipeptidase